MTNTYFATALVSAHSVGVTIRAENIGTAFELAALQTGYHRITLFHEKRYKPRQALANASPHGFAFQSLKRAAVSSHERPWAFKTAHLLTLGLLSVNPPPNKARSTSYFEQWTNHSTC